MAIENRQLRLPPWLVPVVGGTVLSVVGAALLADRLGVHLPHRWAFLVLLVPAAVAIADGSRGVWQLGRLGLAAVSRLVAGVLFSAIALLLFLELDTGLILPVLMLVLGLGAVVRALLRS